MLAPVFGHGSLPMGMAQEQREESGPAGVSSASPAQLGTAKDTASEEASQARPVEDQWPLSEQLRRLKQQFLDLQATDQGTSVTTFLHRFELSTEYRERPVGIAENRSVLRIDQPIGQRGLVRVDVLYQTQDTGSSGIGDLFLRTGYRILEQPGFKLFIGMDAILATAHADEFGRGKFEIGPGIAASMPIPEINSSFMPILQQFNSVGGDPSRRDVNFSRLQLQLVTPWMEWWTLLQPDFRVDWEGNRKTAMMLDGEIGRKLGPNYRVWLRTGGSLWGSGVAGTYDWLAQIGLRYMF